MISSMLVSLVRDDGGQDNSLTRVIGVVAGRGFQVRSARLKESKDVKAAVLEVAYKGRTHTETTARGEIMRLLGISSLTALREPTPA